MKTMLVVCIALASVAMALTSSSPFITGDRVDLNIRCQMGEGFDRTEATVTMNVQSQSGNEKVGLKEFRGVKVVGPREAVIFKPHNMKTQFEDFTGMSLEVDSSSPIIVKTCSLSRRGVVGGRPVGGFKKFCSKGTNGKIIDFESC